MAEIDIEDGEIFDEESIDDQTFKNKVINEDSENQNESVNSKSTSISNTFEQINNIKGRNNNDLDNKPRNDNHKFIGDENAQICDTKNEQRKRKSNDHAENVEIIDKKRKYQTAINNLENLDEDEDETIFVIGGSLQNPVKNKESREESLSLDSKFHLSNDTFNLENVSKEGTHFNSRFRDRPPPRRDIHKKAKYPIKGKGPPPWKAHQSSPNEVRTCAFYLQGKCLRGVKCEFYHPKNLPSIFEPCRYYMKKDKCNKRATCLYMHDEFPCKFHHTGQKCFADKNCKFSHLELDKFYHDIFWKYINKGPPRRRMDNAPFSKSMDKPLRKEEPPKLRRPPVDNRIPSLFDIRVPVPDDYKSESSESKQNLKHNEMHERNLDVKDVQNQSSHQCDSEIYDNPFEMDYDTYNAYENQIEYQINKNFRDSKDTSVNNNLKVLANANIPNQRYNGENCTNAVTPIPSPDPTNINDEDDELKKHISGKTKKKSEHHRKKHKKDGDDENKKKKGKKKSKHSRSNSEEKRYLEKEIRKLNKKEKHRGKHEKRVNDVQNYDFPANPIEDDVIFPAEVLIEQVNKSNAPDENKSIPDALAHLPKIQQELYLRIKQQQKEADNLDETHIDENEDDDYKDNLNWYSSDEESSSSSNLMTNIKTNFALPTLSPSTFHQMVDNPTKSVSPTISDPTVLNMAQFANIHISDEVSKLLSTIRMQTQTNDRVRSNDTNHMEFMQTQTNQQVCLNDTNQMEFQSKSPPSESVRDKWGNLASMPLILNEDLSNAGAENESDDIDVNNLPFKPVPVHDTANEIEASITSHPVMEYKLIPVSNITKTNYIAVAAMLGGKMNSMDPRFKVYRPNKNDKNQPVLPDVKETSNVIPKTVEIKQDRRVEHVRINLSKSPPSVVPTVATTIPYSPHILPPPVSATIPNNLLAIDRTGKPELDFFDSASIQLTTSVPPPPIRNAERRDPRLTSRHGASLSDSRINIIGLNSQNILNTSIPPPPSPGNLNVILPDPHQNYNMNPLQNGPNPPLLLNSHPVLQVDSVSHMHIASDIATNIPSRPTDIINVLPLRRTDPRIRKQ